MWFLYFLPILIVIPFLIANRNRQPGSVTPRGAILALAAVLVSCVGAFVAFELVR